MIAGELRVYYDRQYFWKLSISASKRPTDVDFPNLQQRSLPVPRMGSPPPASDLDYEYGSAASLATGSNELTFDPEDMETNFGQECRDEILKEHGLRVTDAGQVVSANEF